MTKWFNANGLDDYDYRVTDHIMEDAFQARKRKIDAEHNEAIDRAREEQRRDIYILYFESWEGGYVERFSDYDSAKGRALDMHKNYSDAYIEISKRGTKLLWFQGNKGREEF